MTYIDGYLKNNLVHSIHTSERKAFRACRRRWNWTYRQGYSPRFTPKPLEFGLAWHVAMETWYDPDMWFKDREFQAELAVSMFAKTVSDQLKLFKELNGEPNEDQTQWYKDSVELGIKMVNYYTKRVSPILDVTIVPLAVEIPFEVPLDRMNCNCEKCWKLFVLSDFGQKYIKNDIITRRENGAGCRCTDYREVDIWKMEHWQGLPVTFGGRIDAIFQDEDGRILVFDWKSANKLMSDESESAFLQLDDQIAGYSAALYSMGRQCDGFIYHEQKKSVPDKPKELKRKYKGMLFSTDKNADVEYQTFLNTVQEFDEVAYRNGLYDEYLLFLRSPTAPRFFQRHIIYKTSYQMDMFLKDLHLEAMDMISHPRIYPQPSRFSCNSCLFRIPCEGMNRGEDYEYTLDSMYEKRNDVNN